MTVHLQHIPPELRALDQWVLWKAEARNGKATKIPYSARSTGRASSTDPQTWASFDDARTAYDGGGYDGIGFVFTKDDDVVGVDLDKCIDDAGAAEPWAQEIIYSLDSYTEVTPSGRGFHVICRGTLPPGRRRKGRVEVYSEGRFFTFTGRHVEGTPPSVEERTRELERLHDRLFSEESKKRRELPSPPLNGLALSDNELIQKARRAGNGDRFDRLWRGDASRYDDDASAADLALCNHLSFWTGGDGAHVDRLFRQSGLMRPKWDERRGERTYGERTVAAALESCTDYYDPERGTGGASPRSSTVAAGVTSTVEPQDEVAALPQRAYDLLPRTFREAVAYFDGWHKRDVFLTALLGTLSSALPKVRIHYGQAYHSPHLYLFVIARAASGKGVMAHAFRWLDPTDELVRREWQEEHEAWQRQKDTYEQAKRSRKDSPLSPDPPGPEPPERCLKAGANTTAAALGVRLGANPYGVFVGSTEADTLTSSNRREHGDFSHLLRQAFHHEEAQVDRKTESTLRVKHPRFALVLSGTPKQFPRFMGGGLEDGLFSRFGVYSFEAPAVFEAQWATDRDRALEAFTERAGRRVRELYELLRGRREPLYFDVPEHLRPPVEDAFRMLHDELAAGSAYDLLPTVRRGVVIALRIAAVLAVWRAFEEGALLATAQNVVATEADVKAAVALGLVYVEHALREALRMEPDSGAMPDTGGVGGKARMTGPQRRFYDALPATFKTAEAETVAGSLDVPRSTMYDWLGRFLEGGLLAKPGHGRYEKPRQGGEPSGDGVGLPDFVGFPVVSPRKGDSALDSSSDFGPGRLDYASRTSNGSAEVQAKVQLRNGSSEAERQESPRVQRSPEHPPLRVGQRVATSRGPGTLEEIPGPRQKVKVRLDALAGTPIPTRAFDAADLTPLPPEGQEA